MGIPSGLWHCWLDDRKMSLVKKVLQQSTKVILKICIDPAQYGVIFGKIGKGQK